MITFSIIIDISDYHIHGIICAIFCAQFLIANEVSNLTLIVLYPLQKNIMPRYGQLVMGPAGSGKVREHAYCDMSLTLLP